MTARLFTILILLPVCFSAAFAQAVLNETPPLSGHTDLWDDLPKNPIMMWRIEKDGHAVHLVGSLHMGPDDLYPLPAEMTNTFIESEAVVFEVDPESLNEAFQTRLSKLGTLPKGTTLSSLLDEETNAKVNAAVKKAHFPGGVLDDKKPWMAALILTISYSMQAQDTMSMHNGIDRYFITEAKRARKKVFGLETVEEQLRLFNGLDDETSIEFLKKTLDEIDKIKPILNSMIDAWKSGDADKLDEIVQESFSGYPDVYQSWVVDRNTKWAGRVDAYFESRTRAFIVVGAAHAAGPDSLQEILKARGYSVQQMTDSPLAIAP